METDIKNESVDVGASADSKTETYSGISNNDYTSKTAGCQAPAKMYDFDNGAVRLEFSDGGYHVYVHGEEQVRGYNAVQMANPRIAIMLFTSCIDSYLSEKVGSYLVSLGFNRIMGCKVNMPCINCKENKFNTAVNHCRFYEDSK